MFLTDAGPKRSATTTSSGHERRRTHLLALKPLEEEGCLAAEWAVVVECRRVDHPNLINDLLVGRVHHDERGSVASCNRRETRRERSGGAALDHPSDTVSVAVVTQRSTSRYLTRTHTHAHTHTRARQ
jgi:hypothetical protein